VLGLGAHEGGIARWVAQRGLGDDEPELARRLVEQVLLSHALGHGGADVAREAAAGCQGLEHVQGIGVRLEEPWDARQRHFAVGGHGLPQRVHVALALGHVALQLQVRCQEHAHGLGGQQRCLLLIQP